MLWALEKVVLAALIVPASAAPVNCQGPPYLLVTFHGGDASGDVNQMYQYTRDGCLLSDAVLGSSAGIDLRELRGAALMDDGSLAVENSYVDNSQLLPTVPALGAT